MKTPLHRRDALSASKLVLCELQETGISGLESFSTASLKVHRALRAAGLSYETRRSVVPLALGQLGATTRVPLFLVDEEPVLDAPHFLPCLEQLGIRTLVPTDSRVRAEAGTWEIWADQVLGNFVDAARWVDERNWSRVREAFFGKAPWLVRAFVAPRIRARETARLVARDALRGGEKALWEEFRRVLDMLEARAPEAGFWLGDALSVADLAIFAQLHTLRNDITPRQARELKLRPVLTDWLDRVDAATSHDATSFPAFEARSRRLFASPSSPMQDTFVVAARVSLADAAFCG